MTKSSTIFFSFILLIVGTAVLSASIDGDDRRSQIRRRSNFYDEYRGQNWLLARLRSLLATADGEQEDEQHQRKYVPATLSPQQQQCINQCNGNSDCYMGCAGIIG